MLDRMFLTCDNGQKKRVYLWREKMITKGEMPKNSVANFDGGKRHSGKGAAIENLTPSSELSKCYAKSLQMGQQAYNAPTDVALRIHDVISNMTNPATALRAKLNVEKTAVASKAVSSKPTRVGAER